MMIIKRWLKVDRNHGLSFTVGALKSPFEKGDLEAIGQPSKVSSCHSERSEESYKP